MGYLWERLFFGRNMGYESRAVIAVDNTIYTDVTWGEYTPDEIITHGDRTYYSFEWDKATYGAVTYFLDEVVKKETSSEDGHEFYDNESYGVIMLGEAIEDINTYGAYWEFDMDVVRSIEVY
jgi:hypothetical protein